MHKNTQSRNLQFSPSWSNNKAKGHIPVFFHSFANFSFNLPSTWLHLHRNMLNDHTQKCKKLEFGIFAFKIIHGGQSSYTGFFTFSRTCHVILFYMATITLDYVELIYTNISWNLEFFTPSPNIE